MYKIMRTNYVNEYHPAIRPIMSSLNNKRLFRTPNAKYHLCAFGYFGWGVKWYKLNLHCRNQRYNANSTYSANKDLYVFFSHLMLI